MSVCVYVRLFAILKPLCDLIIQILLYIFNPKYLLLKRNLKPLLNVFCYYNG